MIIDEAHCETYTVHPVLEYEKSSKSENNLIKEFTKKSIFDKQETFLKVIEIIEMLILTNKEKVT